MDRSWFVRCVFASCPASPGTWLGGAWVPGGPRPGLCCCLSLIHVEDAPIQFRFSPVSHAKRASPKFMVSGQYLICSLTSYKMRPYDQVAWTSWHSIKKHGGEQVHKLSRQKDLSQKSLLYRLDDPTCLSSLSFLLKHQWQRLVIKTQQELWKYMSYPGPQAPPKSTFG